MTTIVYRNGVMASDTLMISNLDMMGYCHKVFRIKEHLVGMAGSKWVVTAFLDWAQKNFEADRSLPEMPFFTTECKDDEGAWGYVVTPLGQIYRYEKRGLPFLVESEYVACGSGREYALGAMACGKGPEEAVGIAMLFDRGSGGEIRSLKLGE